MTSHVLPTPAAASCLQRLMTPDSLSPTETAAVADLNWANIMNASTGVDAVGLQLLALDLNSLSSCPAPCQALRLWLNEVHAYQFLLGIKAYFANPGTSQISLTQKNTIVGFRMIQGLPFAMQQPTPSCSRLTLLVRIAKYLTPQA